VTEQHQKRSPELPSFRIRNVAPRTAEVDILDAIGAWYGVTAKDVAEQLKDLDVDQINLRINSPGGDVFDGIAIMNTLRQHKATVTANVIGLAASAASFIAVGGADQVVMAENSMMMIHDASGLVLGNAQDMHEAAGLLDQISNNIADVYAGKAGGTGAEWRQTMRGERWYTAAEAVDAGLADSMDGPVGDQPQDAALARVKASARQPTQGHTIDDVRAAAAALGAPNPTTNLPAAPRQETTTTHKEDARMNELIKGLCQRLGLPEDAAQADILSTLDNRLAEPRIPDGIVAVDQAVYDELQTELAAGRQAIAKATAERRDGLLQDALQAGKITAASADLWRTQLDTNEAGTVALLDSMPANRSVPVEMLGYTGGVDEAPDDETALYNRVYKKEA